MVVLPKQNSRFLNVVITREVEVDPRNKECNEPPLQELREGDQNYADKRGLISTTAKGLEPLINMVKDHCVKNLMPNMKSPKSRI